MTWDIKAVTLEEPTYTPEPDFSIPEMRRFLSAGYEPFAAIAIDTHYMRVFLRKEIKDDEKDRTKETKDESPMLTVRRTATWGG